MVVGRTWGDLCPVAAVVSFLAIRGVDGGPLFRLQSGSPLTQAGFVDRLKRVLLQAGIQPDGFSGHSFRIGACTTAAANGVSDASIQLMGRWSSDCFRRYIRPANSDLARISNSLT